MFNRLRRTPTRLDAAPDPAAARGQPPEAGARPTPPRGGEGAAANGDAVISALLDTTGALLQAIGQFALDTDASSAESATTLAERWRRHVTAGLAHPADVQHADDGAEVGVRGVGIAGRDWTGMLRFAVEQQRGERTHALRVNGELRDTVWTLVRGLDAVVGAERETGRALASSVERVREAVDAASHDTLREAALAAAGELAALVERRERERREQIATLGDRVRRLGAALEQARRDGAADPLTGLGNRRALDDALANARTLRGLWGQPACLLLFDVDGLKAVNDSAGHAAGDDALRCVAREMARVFLGATDALCRFGGDEFAVVLRDTTAETAERLAERLVRAVATQAAWLTAVTDCDAAARAFGLSAGVAALGDGESAADWFARADAALYAAKWAGKGRVVVG